MASNTDLVSAAPTALTIRFQAERVDGTTLALVSGASLVTGDRFWMILDVAAPLHVVVLYVDPSGAASVLYPLAGEVRLEPGRTHRIPDNLADAFQLDQEVGWERLLVIASEDPLARVDARYAQVVARVRSDQRWPGDLLELSPESGATGAKSGGPPPPTKARTRVAAKASSTQGSTKGPLLREVTITADNRGGPPAATRGVAIVRKETGSIESKFDEQGLIAVPLFIQHLAGK